RAFDRDGTAFRGANGTPGLRAARADVVGAMDGAVADIADDLTTAFGALLGRQGGALRRSLAGVRGRCVLSRFGGRLGGSLSLATGGERKRAGEEHNEGASNEHRLV